MYVWKVNFGLHCKKLDFNIAHRISDNCNFYQAKMWLYHNIVTNTVIIIYSDNQTVIRTLEAISLNSQASVDYRIAHNEIGEQFNIYLICMPV